MLNKLDKKTQNTYPPRQRIFNNSAGHCWYRHVKSLTRNSRYAVVRLFNKNVYT